jgi:nitroimidazol reductase NimA-like FMN-containing flavoprotein (pyridoxamine 5'-phosphate oxidase superfamily)
MEIDRNGLEVLERDECLRLLDTVAVGRVAFTSQALPCVLPVNFRRDGDRILFRTGEGTKLATATRNTVVGFEFDDFDPDTNTGWSVLIVGMAHRLPDADADATSSLDLPRWAPGDDGHVVAVSTELVSGRRIHPNGNSPS